MSKIPPEIQESLSKFRNDYPEPQNVCFIMMAFRDRQEYALIEQAIKEALKDFDLIGLRADQKEYHPDLYWNVVTYMHGCGFGVAVFEHIDVEALNPNVALEVGYMMALGKPVCLLKEKNIKKMSADVLGKLYREFNISNPEAISRKLSQWLGEKKPFLALSSVSDSAKRLAEDGEKLWKSSYTEALPLQIRAWVDRILEKIKEIPELYDDDLFQGKLIALKERTGPEYNGRYASEWAKFFPQIISQLNDFHLERLEKKRKQRALNSLSEMGISFSEDEFMNRVRKGDDEAALLFLEAGIRTNVADVHSGKAFYEAVRQGMVRTVKAIIEKGFDVTSDRNMAIWIASGADSPEIITILVNAGANVNVQDPNNKITPLFNAAQKGKLDIAKALLENGADARIGKSPLENVDQAKNPELAKILYEAGATAPPKPPKSY